MSNQPSSVTVAIGNTIEADDAASILGCSYPHLINLIHQKKLKAQKIGKKWYVDATDVQRAKSTKLVTPRPRKNKTNVLNGNSSLTKLGQDEIEIRITMSKSKYDLLDVALRGKGNRNLKQHLESKVDELHEILQKHISSVNF